MVRNQLGPSASAAAAAAAVAEEEFGEREEAGVAVIAEEDGVAAEEVEEAEEAEEAEDWARRSTGRGRRSRRDLERVQVDARRLAKGAGVRCMMSDFGERPNNFGK